MGLYELLKMKKEEGMAFDFEQITYNDLKQMFYDEGVTDSRIADLFEVTPSKVKYKRKKMKITLRNSLIIEILENKGELADNINIEAHDRLFLISKVDTISKALTHFAFRNGPVEDMHADGKLTQEDMKKLNKFLVNRLSYVFKLIIENRWLELELLIQTNDMYYGHDWDKAEPDDGGNLKLAEMFLSNKSF